MCTETSEEKLPRLPWLSIEGRRASGRGLKSHESLSSAPSEYQALEEVEACQGCLQTTVPPGGRVGPCSSWLLVQLEAPTGGWREVKEWGEEQGTGCGAGTGLPAKDWGVVGP